MIGVFVAFHLLLSDDEGHVVVLPVSGMNSRRGGGSGGGISSLRVQSRGQEVLGGRGREKVIAACDLVNAHSEVIDDDSKVICPIAVPAVKDNVIDWPRIGVWNAR